MSTITTLFNSGVKFGISYEDSSVIKFEEMTTNVDSGDDAKQEEAETESNDVDDNPPGFDSSTFITSIRDSTKENKKVKEKLNYNVKSIGRIKDLHAKLSNVVCSLSEKVTDVLKKQEDEFLAAYRTHMYNVQKELQELRAKVSDSELQLKRDSKIQKLEEERDWYRKEALRLDTLCTGMKKDIQYIKERSGVLEDDRKWLEKQLKNAKKQNKLLKAELEMHLVSYGDHSVERGDIEKNNYAKSKTNNQQKKHNKDSSEIIPVGSALLRPSLSHGTLKMPSQTIAVFPDPTGKEPRSKSSMGMYKETDFDGIGEATPTTSSDSQKLRRKIFQLKEQLNVQRHKLQELRASVVTDQAEKGELEVLFLECVNEVKKDISRRRLKSKLNRTKTNTRKKETVQIGVAYNSILEEIAALRRDECGRIPINDFTAVDRRKVLNTFLLKEDVFTMLYDKIFPSNTEIDDMNCSVKHDSNVSTSMTTFPGLEEGSI